jgi:hypothetical protein
MEPRQGDLDVRLNWSYAGWQLAQRTADGISAVRNLSDTEMEHLNDSLWEVRNHIKARPTRLLDQATAALLHAIESMPVPWSAPDHDQELFDLISLPTVSWLLMWRMQRENLTADLRSKLRGNEVACAEFEAAKREIFDANPSYRLAEALRDYVQHYASPPIQIRRSAHLGTDTAVVGSSTIEVLPELLLSWRGLKAPARKTLSESDATLDLRALVLEAMSGMLIVTRAYERLVSDAFSDSVSRLFAVLEETQPWGPIFARADRTADGNYRMEMRPAADVVAWLLGRPNPNLQ